MRRKIQQWFLNIANIWCWCVRGENVFKIWMFDPEMRVQGFFIPQHQKYSTKLQHLVPHSPVVWDTLIAEFVWWRKCSKNIELELSHLTQCWQRVYDVASPIHCWPHSHVHPVHTVHTVHHAEAEMNQTEAPSTGPGSIKENHAKSWASISCEM